MRIVGIGSCLSERVAGKISEKTQSEIITLVRHNRSDQLLPVLRGLKPPPVSTLRDILHRYGPGHETNKSFIFGQSIEGMGRSTNENLVTLPEAMDDRSVDLVLIDNFMDLVADLWQEDSGLSLFARLPRENGMERMPRLRPRIAADNYRGIFAEAGRIWPSARIVFMHFPYNNYKEDTKKPEWGRDFFARLMKARGASVIAPWQVPASKLRNDEPHHYHHSVYGEIADEVLRLVSAQNQPLWRRAISLLSAPVS